MTQNKKYPLAFKAAVNREIYYESGSKIEHFGINSNLDYSQIQFDYKIHQLKTFFGKKILNICNNSFVQKIIPATSQKVSAHISGIQSQYFSQAREVLQKNKKNTKFLDVGVRNFGYKLQQGKNFNECSEGERNIYFYNLIHDFNGIEECVEYLNLYYQEDDDKKEEIISIIINEYNRILGESEHNVWKVAKKLNCLFGVEFQSRGKKMDSILLLLKTLKNHVYSELFKTNNFTEEEGKKIAQTMFNLGCIKSLNSYYDLLNILDEEFNFKMAVESSSQSPSDFAFNIGKFRIHDPVKFKELTQYQFRSPKDGPKVGNYNFINHAHDFIFDFDEYYSIVISSLYCTTTPKYSHIYENIQKKEHFGSILKIFFEVGYLEKDNFQEFIDFLETLNGKDLEIILMEAIEGLKKKTSFIEVLKFLKNNFLDNKFGKIIFKEILAFQIQINPEKIFRLYIHEEQQLCTIKEDLLLFIALLKEKRIIDQNLYDAIISDKKDFENLKNFTSLILSNNITEVPENNPEKASRDIFCEQLGIVGRLTSKNYSHSDVQKFYLYAYQLHRDLSQNFGDNFFQKLKISDDLLLSQNISKLNDFLQLLYYFSALDGRESQYYVKDLNFPGLLKDFKLRKKVTNIDFSEITSDNIEKIIFQLEYILGSILHNFFPKHIFTTLDFEKLKEKWGSLENIFGLIPYLQRNSDIRDIVGNIIQSEIDGKFGEYKYEGAYESEYIKYIFKNQVKFLSKEQLNTWRKNSQKLTFFSGGNNNNNNFTQEDFLKNIYNNLIIQKHFDELGEGCTQKIINFEGNSEFFQDIYIISKRQEILEKYESISEEDFILISSQAIIQAKNIGELKSAIQFFLFITKKLNKNIGTLENELKMYLGEIKNLENSNNSQKTKEQFILTLFTDNPNIALNIGNIVGGDYSCQDYKQLTAQAKALPGYLIDAGVKILISFSLGEKDFSSKKEWEEVKNYLQNNPNNYVFNQYTRIISINGNEYGPLRGVYRNIVKLGSTHGDASVFQEKAYKSVSGDLQNFVRETHKSTLGKIRDEMMCVPCNSSTTFSQTRNPGGIYSDQNRGIMYTDYKYNQ